MATDINDGINDGINTLVLSGNSTNALATLGSLQKLFDSEIIIKSNISAYYGTSSGSMICTLLSIGFDPIEILAHICANKSYSKIPSFNLTNLPYGSVLNFDYIKHELEKLLIAKLGYIPTLNCIRERFGKSLYFVTYNMSKGEKEYLSSDTYPNLSVTEAVRMSSAFPFIFSPYEYNDNYYIDGGIVENFPIMTAQLAGGRCFGLCNKHIIKSYTPQLNYFEHILNLLSILITSAADNIIILPGSRVLKLPYETNFFNFTSSNSDLIKMFDEGYDACAAAL